MFQMLVRHGFDIRRHALSLLTNGDLGWIQILNFVLPGLLVVAGAFGMRRALRWGRDGTWGPLLLVVHGLGLIGAEKGLLPSGNGSFGRLQRARETTERLNEYTKKGPEARLDDGLFDVDGHEDEEEYQDQNNHRKILPLKLVAQMVEPALVPIEQDQLRGATRRSEQPESSETSGLLSRSTSENSLCGIHRTSWKGPAC
jgi:Protein of unknown function (DUF998)